MEYNDGSILTEYAMGSLSGERFDIRMHNKF